MHNGMDVHNEWQALEHWLWQGQYQRAKTQFIWACERAYCCGAESESPIQQPQANTLIKAWAKVEDFYHGGKPDIAEMTFRSSLQQAYRAGLDDTNPKRIK